VQIVGYGVESKPNPAAMANLYLSNLLFLKQLLLVAHDMLTAGETKDRR
jgi:hypothetical protein